MNLEDQINAVATTLTPLGWNVNGGDEGTIYFTNEQFPKVGIVIEWDPDEDLVPETFEDAYRRETGQ